MMLVHRSYIPKKVGSHYIPKKVGSHSQLSTLRQIRQIKLPELHMRSMPGAGIELTTLAALVRHLNHLATEYFPCIVLGIMQSHSSDVVLLIIQSSCILPLGDSVQLKTKWLLVVV